MSATTSVAILVATVAGSMIVGRIIANAIIRKLGGDPS